MDKIPLQHQYADAVHSVAGQLIAHDDGPGHSSTTLSRISYIGAVSEQERLGAFAPKTKEGGMLSGIDSRSILKILEVLQSMGIGLNPEHLVTYLTLREHDEALTKYDNAHCLDFLHHPIPTDILVMGFIPFDYDLTGINSYAPGFQVSPKHTLDDAWLDAAIQSGTKIVITFGGPKEVNGDHFAFPYHRKSPFKSITHAFEQAASSESKLNRMILNVGIHRDYLEALKNRYSHQQVHPTGNHHLSPQLANV